jgi:hypothetical protein
MCYIAIRERIPTAPLHQRRIIMNYLKGLFAALVVPFGVRELMRLATPFLIPTLGHEMMGALFFLQVLIFTLLELYVFGRVSKMGLSWGSIMIPLGASCIMRFIFTFTDVGGVVAMFAYNYPLETKLVLTSVMTLIITALCYSIRRLELVPSDMSRA